MGNERWIKFGQWVKSVRQSKGLTQREAAGRIGLKTVQQWSRYETGVSASRDRVIALSEALGVSAEEALNQAGFSTEDPGCSMEIVSEQMLKAVVEYSSAAGDVKLDYLRWLSKAKSILGIELDTELCLILLRKKFNS